MWLDIDRKAEAVMLACDQRIRAAEQLRADQEAPWDGFCGLVRVCDDEELREKGIIRPVVRKPHQNAPLAQQQLGVILSSSEQQQQVQPITTAQQPLKSAALIDFGHLSFDNAAALAAQAAAAAADAEAAAVAAAAAAAAAAHPVEAPGSLSSLVLHDTDDELAVVDNDWVSSYLVAGDESDSNTNSGPNDSSNDDHSNNGGGTGLQADVPGPRSSSHGADKQATAAASSSQRQVSADAADQLRLEQLLQDVLQEAEQQAATEEAANTTADAPNLKSTACPEGSHSSSQPPAQAGEAGSCSADAASSLEQDADKLLQGLEQLVQDIHSSSSSNIGPAAGVADQQQQQQQDADASELIIAAEDAVGLQLKHEVPCRAISAAAAAAAGAVSSGCSVLLASLGQLHDQLEPGHSLQQEQQEQDNAALPVLTSDQEAAALLCEVQDEVTLAAKYSQLPAAGAASAADAAADSASPSATGASYCTAASTLQPDASGGSARSPAQTSSAAMHSSSTGCRKVGNGGCSNSGSSCSGSGCLSELSDADDDVAAVIAAAEDALVLEALHGALAAEGTSQPNQQAAGSQGHMERFNSSSSNAGASEASSNADDGGGDDDDDDDDDEDDDSPSVDGSSDEGSRIADELPDVPKHAAISGPCRQ